MSAAFIKSSTGYFELEDVRKLVVANKPIGSLATAGCAVPSCTNVNFLRLRKCDLRNLDGIESLTSLKYLDISDNKISQLGPLAKLTLLEELHLSNNAITDIKQFEALKSLPNLRILSVGPGRGNTVAIGDRHILPLGEMLPQVQVLDNTYIQVHKITKPLTSAINSLHRDEETAAETSEMPPVALSSATAIFKPPAVLKEAQAATARLISEADTFISTLQAR